MPEVSAHSRMERAFIVEEVRRTAAANGGVPLGRQRLETEAGIKAHHWQKFWARYSELVTEAGFPPNSKLEPWSEDELCGLIVAVARELGRFPVDADLRVRKSAHPDFPNHRVFDRTLGGKADKVAKVREYCRGRASHDDVLAMCAEARNENPATAPVSADVVKDGHVYLMKSGKYYKIGFSIHAGARERQLAIQLPDPVSTVHVIVTDDPPGIEAYWHRRFSEKRKNGEWFALSREDVAAFRRRKFM